MIEVYKKGNKWCLVNWSQNVTSSFETKIEAIKQAKKQAQGNIIVHNKDGSIDKKLNVAICHGLKTKK